MTYSELYRNGTKVLSRAGIPEAALDARLLLEFITGCDRTRLLTEPDMPVGDKDAEAFENVLLKRANHIPLQYLTGSCNFMGIDFAVNENVLIPRQDSECLVEEAMRYVGDGSDILDMCTGSGCLLLSLMHYKNNCRGVGVDISEEALKIANKNLRMLGENDGLNGGDAVFLQGDMYDALSEHDRKFDYIISNPPYIRSDVIDTLMPEVRDHEPHIALDGGDDGLDFYRRIISGAPAHLANYGMLFLEIGFDQAEDVSRILTKAGFRDISVIKDYSDNDRVISARNRV